MSKNAHKYVVLKCNVFFSKDAPHNAMASVSNNAPATKAMHVEPCEASWFTFLEHTTGAFSWMANHTNQAKCKDRNWHRMDEH